MLLSLIHVLLLLKLLLLVVLKGFQLFVSVESRNMESLSNRLCPEFATRGTGRRIFCHFTETAGNSLPNIGNIRRLRNAPSIFDADIKDDDDDDGITDAEDSADTVGTAF